MATPTISKTFKWFFNSNFKLNIPRRLSKSKPTTSRSSPPPLAAAAALPPRKGSASQSQPLVEAAFRHFDADGDGKISGEELRSYFASVGESLTRDSARRVIREFDADGDEMLELQDFVRLVEGDKEEDDLRRAFEMFEEEKGCGFIGAAGLRQMFRRLGYVRTQDECMGMIRVFDLDGDGVIDYREFLRMMS